ncbi:MAG: hydantoinase/oxoprolinase family protein [Dehalococcoidia bacterium]
MPAILGVDVGGTFTDFLLWEDGRLRIDKRPSTPADPSDGVIDGLVAMGARPSEVIHGSTVATNALLERRGARTALVTTRGFRDVLVIGRQARARIYDLHPTRPEPIVPDELRLEIDERVDSDGRILLSPTDDQIDEVLQTICDRGANSVAVSLLFSFLQPEHERRIAARARVRAMSVSTSHEVLPEYREYERTSTTAVNAYVSPLMATYLGRLEQRVRERGVRRLRVMQSDGGSMSADLAARLAVRTVLSGPAGGVTGAFAVAQAAGFPQAITFDMGGTSTDVALCPGTIPTRDEISVGGLPVRTPVADVHTVGAGGGSIARLDSGGALRVGPESAGADPGPACYGRGELPTVSDAQLALGRLRADRFLGGRMPLYPDRAHGALEPLAGAFGSVEAAASATIRVANSNMERAIRVVSVERGHDPRDFTLVAFGGAGPLHACELAELLRIPRVLVPPYPGVLSALGMVAAPIARDSFRSWLRTLSTGDETRDTLREAVAELKRRTASELSAEGLPTSRAGFELSLAMRYVGQSYELLVPAPSLKPAAILAEFHDAHRRRFGHADESRPVEAVTLRLRAVLPGTQIDFSPPEAASGRPRIGTVDVTFDRSRRAALFDRDRLRPDDRLRGPAIVTQMDTTTVVPPGWSGVVDSHGNLLLEGG